MDDPAVAGRAAEAERLGLDERDGGAAAGELACRSDPRVAAADDDDVDRVRQRPVRAGPAAAGIVACQYGRRS